MQKKVTFYSLSDNQESENSHQQVTLHACIQAANCYRQNQRVFIYTSDQQSAHNIDEMLWAFDANAFVPHNLVGEGPKQGAAVEISWQPPRNRRPVLINLTSTMPHFASQFSTIIDFVPVDESLKVLARERWKACKQNGFHVENQPAPTLTESIHAINS